MLTRVGQRFAFNSIGRAGPRRLIMIGGLALGVVGLVIGASMLGPQAPVVSRDARMKPIDPLPGGPQSNPEQDKLALKTNQEGATAALAAGESFTPQMAPSESFRLPPPMAETPASASPAPKPLRFVGREQPAVTPVQYAPPAPPPPTPAAPAAGTPSSADQQAAQTYQIQINNLLSEWGMRAPRTDVVLPPNDAQPASPQGSGGSDGVAAGAPVLGRPPVPVMGRPPAPAVSKASVPADGPASTEAHTVLVPAGRGVFAHTVLAVNSDATSPVVLQADSGPIAGDRMIGQFSRENDRLIVRVSSIVHGGETIGVDGVAIAPDTMEAAVASSVDEHYMTRFVLPAAAAFVQGLGQALATTSNTIGVLSTFGGASYLTKLNLPQQLGVGAGVAAGQIGNTLNQAAPKGPTVHLDANVTVGVMFMSNVMARQ
jgi:intracellular multiplication protein IcmE